MGIQTQIDRLSTNIADAYAALAELGAAMPSVKNSDNLAATIASILPGSENAFIKFSCASSMNITSSAIFDGSLEASEDGGPWKAWTGGSYLFGKQICIRGTGNTKMSGAWALGSAYNNKIFCTGNIEALLDYETVEAGGHPTMASGCYRYMFKNCTLLASAPALPATTLLASCYARMFYGCSQIKLSATQDETYTKPYRIPTEGTGTSASTALSRMFLDSSNSYFTPLHQHHVLSSVHGDDRQPGRNAVVRGCAA